MLPLDTLVKIVEGLPVDIKLKIPGILVIDTPGHEAFFNLRRRGGSIANFAILVIDINSGAMPQTIESIDILTARHTPFVVVANKIDLIKGWQPQKTLSIITSLSKQSKLVRTELDTKLYQIIGKLTELGVNADIFSNIKNFRNDVAVLPTSAKTGEGISELIAIIIGVAQSFLSDELTVDEGVGKGVVLEVLEETGLGLTINAIIYSGSVKVNDIIVIGGLDGAITTRIKALLMPKPLDEMRDPREKFSRVAQVDAAVGVKIIAPNIEKVIPGAPIISVKNEEDLKRIVALAEQDIQAAAFIRETQGIVVKADTLGSLEALISELEKRGIKIHSGGVGEVSRTDVVEASTVTGDLLNRVVLAFNTRTNVETRQVANELGVRIFEDRIIYGLIDAYVNWKEEENKLSMQQRLEKLTLPGKAQILTGLVFRRSKPAVFGVKVIGGTIKPGNKVITSRGKNLGEVQQMQTEGHNILAAKTGEDVAISVSDAVFGRDFEENEIIYVDIPSSEIPILKTVFKDSLPVDSESIIDELLTIKKAITKK